MKSDVYIRIEGRILKLTHLNKVFFPSVRFTKGQVIDYYRQIAPVVLPYLRDRPFTFRRFPSGVLGPSFFEKQCPHHRPNWVKTAEFDKSRHCLVNDLPTLIWTANLAAIELHCTLATIRNPECPSFLVLDLDPGENAGMQECAQVALRIRAYLTRFGLESFPKTSGMKGLHVCIPLNSGTSYFASRTFAQNLAKQLEQKYSDLVVSTMSKKHRIRKVLIDWSQNTEFKTTATAYSLRANDHPTVSTPLGWKEVENAGKFCSHARAIANFDTQDVLLRIRRRGDLFEPVISKFQNLPRIPSLGKAA